MRYMFVHRRRIVVCSISLKRLAAAAWGREEWEEEEEEEEEEDGDEGGGSMLEHQKKLRTCYVFCLHISPALQSGPECYKS
jgi:hypothetical protein